MERRCPASFHLRPQPGAVRPQLGVRLAAPPRRRGKTRTVEPAGAGDRCPRPAASATVAPAPPRLAGYLTALPARCRPAAPARSARAPTLGPAGRPGKGRGQGPSSRRPPAGVPGPPPPPSRRTYHGTDGGEFGDCH